LDKNHLDFPNTIKTLKHIKETMNLDINIYQKTVENVIKELNRVAKNE